MRTLVFILLAAVWGDAQTLADLARQERHRQARFQSVRVLTNEDVRAAVSRGLPSPEASATVPLPDPVESAEPDPIETWNEEVEEIRSRLRELQDQETALQLRLSDLTNQFTAPVTNENIRRQIQIRLGEAQDQLNTLRDELNQTRNVLQAMEAQGPPRR